jgi:hypothetical protein
VTLLYRAFIRRPEGADPLEVSRSYQGAGRHDNPHAYAALYTSLFPESAVAEAIRRFRGRLLRGRPLERPGGGRVALATLDGAALGGVVDLDEPVQLVERSVRPSAVATRDRDTTQPLALRIYEEGADGLAWWSTVEARWINVTLFADRVAAKLAVVGDPETLTPDHPAVRAAAEAVGMVVP